MLCVNSQAPPPPRKPNHPVKNMFGRPANMCLAADKDVLANMCLAPEGGGRREKEEAGRRRKKKEEEERRRKKKEEEGRRSAR